MLKDALRSSYSVQSGGKSGEAISDIALFVSGPKAGRGVGRGGGCGGTNKRKQDSRGQSKGLSSQAKSPCNHYQKPGHIRPNYSKRQCFKCRGWDHEVVTCSSKIPTPK